VIVVNYCEISTIDMNRGLDTLGTKIALIKEMERTISNKNDVNTAERLLKALGVEVSKAESSSLAAIPFTEARLCINCEHVVRNPVCPMCGSKSHMLLGNVLGLIK
jgi:rRNA maturation endonuclease Nob1